jgi:hypothetical protein
VKLLGHTLTVSSLLLTSSIGFGAGAVEHPEGCNIKGNFGGGKRLYYLPTHPRFEKVLINRPNEKWFCSEEQALAAGWKSAGSIDGRVGLMAPKSTCEIPKDAPSESCAIKGNINNNGDRIVHLPCTKYYSRTEIRTEDGERWFCSLDEALLAGWRQPLN